MTTSRSPYVPNVQRTAIDGVPTLWAEAPGQLTAVLTFRVGRADETPLEGGLSHLVEHLAMTPVGQPRFDCNAFVDGNRTSFYAAGSGAEVTGFLQAITAALADLPVDRLERETSILKREASGIDDSIAGVHRHVRYGMWGHGLVGQPEFGLGRVSSQRVLDWAQAMFTADNATLCLTGEPPADLRLGLPSGVRRTAPVPVTIPGVKLPVFVEDLPGIAFGFELSRQIGAGSFLSIMHRRLRQRLRHDDGIVYDIVGAYDPLDADTASALLGTDCEADQVQHVGVVAFDVLDDLAAGQVDDDELAGEIDDLERAFADPTATLGLLDAMAFDELLGMPAHSPMDRLAEQRRTRASDIARHADDARQSLILLGSMSAPPAAVHPYPRSSAEPVEGREVKPLLSLFGLGRRQRLLIGDDGVTLMPADGTITTIRYRDVVLLEKPADDELVLWNRDGDRIYIPAIYWKGGARVLAEIEAAIPKELLVEDKLSVDLID